MGFAPLPVLLESEALVSGTVTNSYLERIQQVVLPALGEGIPCFLAKGKIALGLARGEHWIKHGGVSRPPGLPDWVSVVGHGTPSSAPAEPGPAGATEDCFRFANLLLQGHMPVGRPFQVPTRLLGQDLGFPLTVPLGHGITFVPNDQAVWQRMVQNLMDREVQVIGILRAVPITPKSVVFTSDIMLFEAYDLDGRLLWTNPIFGLEAAIQNYRSMSQVKFKQQGENALARAKAQTAALEALGEGIEFPVARPALSAEEVIQVLKPAIADFETLAEAVAALTKEPLAAIRTLLKPPHPRTKEVHDLAATMPPGLPLDKKIKSLADWTDLSTDVIQGILAEGTPSLSPGKPEPAAVTPAHLLPEGLPEHVAEDPELAAHALAKALAASLPNAPGLLADILPVTPHLPAPAVKLPDPSPAPPAPPPAISFEAPTASLFDADQKPPKQIEFSALSPILPGARPGGRPKSAPKAAPSPSRHKEPQKGGEHPPQPPAEVASQAGKEAKTKGKPVSAKAPAAPRTEPRRTPPKIGNPLSGLDALEMFLDLNYREICDEVVRFVKCQPHQSARFHQIAEHLKIGKRDEQNRPIHDALNKRVLKVLVRNGTLMQSGAKKGSQYFAPIK